MVDTRTPQNSISFVLLPNILQPSKEYLARFSVQTASGMSDNIPFYEEMTTKVTISSFAANDMDCFNQIKLRPVLYSYSFPCKV